MAVIPVLVARSIMRPLSSARIWAICRCCAGASESPNQATLDRLTSKEAAGETFNFTNGDLFALRHAWRELADALDPERFIQIHRAVIVNLHRVAQYTSGPGDGGEVQLVDRPERLPVSRSYVHLFKQM